MKHYYDDDGILNYTVPENLVDDFATTRQVIKKKAFVLERAMIVEQAIELEYDYSIVSQMGGLGGCKTLVEWWDTEITPLKRIFYHFITAGYVSGEFKMAAYSLVCACQGDDILAGRVK